jgi:hypothetical protein
MTRKERRAARSGSKRREVGEVIRTQVVGIVDAHGQTGLYWFEWPEGWREGDPLPPAMYGPFKTEAELREHQRLTLLGSQCKVIDRCAPSAEHQRGTASLRGYDSAQSTGLGNCWPTTAPPVLLLT